MKGLMKKVIVLFTVVTVVMALAAGCTQQKQPGEKQNEEKPENVNVYVLTGPTGIGGVNMWEKAAEGSLSENYTFHGAATPDEIVAKISTGEADIAAISTNLAAKLFNKTKGGIKILAVNTLGVLNVLDNTGAEIHSLADLKGRKIVTTGQGANPEYILNHLLMLNGIDREKDVEIEYRAEGTELVSVWAKEPDAVIVAPQPVATSILTKYTEGRNVLDLTDEWEKAEENSSLMMGCVVVTEKFLSAYPEAVKNFMREYADSVEKANSEQDATAELCEKYGIVPKKAIAKAAIPYCNICFIDGEEMKTKLTGYLEVLYNADKSSVGGTMPGDDFWYIEE